MMPCMHGAYGSDKSNSHVWFRSGARADVEGSAQPVHGDQHGPGPGRGQVPPAPLRGHGAACADARAATTWRGASFSAIVPPTAQRGIVNKGKREANAEQPQAEWETPERIGTKSGKQGALLMSMYRTANVTVDC